AHGGRGGPGLAFVGVEVLGLDGGSASCVEPALLGDG
ncbi:MAG: hypothetical protein ACJA0P_004429, partial [Planctomycetota bacterium]